MSEIPNTDIVGEMGASGLEEDRFNLSIQEAIAIAFRKRGVIPALISAVQKLFVFGFVKLFGWIAYDRRYLKGRWFATPWSPGYRWAFNGLFAKIFSEAGQGLPWPVSSQGVFGRNIVFDVDDLNNFQGPGYFQTFGDAQITIGKGS